MLSLHIHCSSDHLCWPSSHGGVRHLIMVRHHPCRWNDLSSILWRNSNLERRRKTIFQKWMELFWCSLCLWLSCKCTRPTLSWALSYRYKGHNDCSCPHAPCENFLFCEDFPYINTNCYYDLKCHLRSENLPHVLHDFDIWLLSNLCYFGLGSS